MKAFCARLVSSEARTSARGSVGAFIGVFSSKSLFYQSKS
jgi:hypothetical protein